ncbi:MAG TPA: AAA family ATPase [Hyphomicrobiaceae bacterium]|nr:AAA family ATPase [Hyphomicrobiaceae bacterium]
MEFEVLYEIWDAIDRLLNNPIVRVISYVVSPILAILAFLWNRKDRREIIEKSTELGRLESEVENAHKSIREKQHELQTASAEIERRGAEIKRLEDDLRRITEGSQELWKLRRAKAFPEYLTWLRDPAGAKLITFGNLKGGVGKTTLAANFAAYLSHTRNKPVLLVDLDYQGSLSNMLMLANEREEVESRVDFLFDKAADLATVDRAAEHLAPKLSRAWLVPANYTFAQLENRLLLQWLLQDEGEVDVRFRLSNALLRPDVRRRYAAIILDMPPRMTLGSLNALVASHFFVVPTVLDKLSVEAVGQFLTNMRAISEDLHLDIELAGVAGVMTRARKLSSAESAALERAREGSAIWRDGRDYVFKTILPRKVDIANAAGEDLAYFGADAEGRLADLFDPLFEEICTAVWRGNGP